MGDRAASPYQLSTLSQASNGSRPTIPYSQSRFPRGPSKEWQGKDEDEYSTEASSAFLSEDEEMVPVGSSLGRQSVEQQKSIPRSSHGVDELPAATSRSLHDAVEDHPDLSHDEVNRDEYDRESEEDDGNDDEETGLTGKDKRRREVRRTQKTQLDHRIAGEGAGAGDGKRHVTTQEMKKADVNVVKRLAINTLLICLWYIFSLSISIYNKWMFDPDHLDFKFPLFTTSMHMVVQFTLASLVLFIFPRFRPRHDSISNPDNIRDETDRSRQESGEKKPIMTWWFYATRLGPCGIATGLDIGLGNMSLKFISLTFYTMCKSSALAFVLIFAFLFRLEAPSWRLVAIIFTMTVGVIMMVFGEVDFSKLGFFLIISAAFFSGFRWALTQILLLRNPATSNPFASIFYLAPIMCVSLLCIAIPVEGLPSLFHGLQNLVEAQGIVKGPAILIFPGTIAFLMTASEFALLQRTSVVTLSIAGIFKEVVTISAAGIVFGDPLTKVNVSGLIVTIGAIAAYNYIKITKMRKEALVEVKLRKEREAQILGFDVHSHVEPADGNGESDGEGEDEGEQDAFLPNRTAGASESLVDQDQDQDYSSDRPAA